MIILAAVHGQRLGLGRCVGNFHKLLPEIIAGKQPHERSWGMLEARDVLLLHEFAFAMPTAERLEGLGLTRGIINPAESHDAPAPRDKVGVIRRAGCGTEAWYIEIEPHSAIRALRLMRASTLLRTAPPTLSKKTSIPLGQSAESRGRRSSLL